MRKKISVIGTGVQIARELSPLADVADHYVSGADVVILAGEADLGEIARSAPAAAVVVVGDAVEERCRQAYEGTLFPRGRIVGIADPERVNAAVESIVLERDEPHDVIAMRDGRFTARSARLGRGGIREFV
jgi:hypothetical protein